MHGKMPDPISVTPYTNDQAFVAETDYVLVQNRVLSKKYIYFLMGYNI